MRSLRPDRKRIYIHAAPRQGAHAKLTRCHMFFLFLFLFLLLLLLWWWWWFLVKYFRSKTSKNTVFCAILLIAKEKTLVSTTFWQRQGRTSSKNIAIYSVFYANASNTLCFAMFFQQGVLKCTANTTVFFMFPLPVLKANQPKTVVFTVF